MAKLWVGLIGLLAGATTPAFANEYVIYQLSCTLFGTVQDFDTPMKRLPEMLPFEVRFAELTNGQAIPQSYSVKILDQQKHRMATPILSQAKGIAAIHNIDNGQICPSSSAVALSFNAVAPAVAQQLLLELGAEGLPDVGQATSLNADHKVDFAAVDLGACGCDSTYGVRTRKSATLAQIHYDYGQYKGLSFHLRVEDCAVRVWDPTVPGRRGD